MGKREFGELELAILNHIKNKKSASVSDIHELLKKEVAYTTVMTVMNRLYVKSYLKRVKESRSFIYSLSKDYKSSFCMLITKKMMLCLQILNI